MPTSTHSIARRNARRIWSEAREHVAAPAQSSAVVRQRVRLACNVLLLGLFLLGIAAPLAGQLSGISQPANVSSENRAPASFPEFKFRQYGPLPWPRKHSLVQFPEKFEAYYNDHLGFRRELVRCYNLARLHGVAPEVLTSPGIGEKQGSPVVVGREGWLFYNRQGSIETYRAAQLFPPAELDAWEAMFRQRRDWLAERGIEYVLVFSPEKPTIYPEHLPRALNRVGDTSRLDQLLERLHAKAAMNVVDLRQPLIAAKARHPTYFRTDTHWNNYGAFVGYQHIMHALISRFPAAQPWALSDFDLAVSECQGLDMAKMLDSLVPLTDTFIELHPRRPRTAFEMPMPAEGARECRRSMNPAAPLERALVLHDSFFVALWPFFNEHWRQIDYRWMYEFPCEAIERERPQVVVQEMVERCLMIYEPCNPPELQTAR